GLRAAGRSAVRSTDAARPSPVTLLARIDDAVPALDAAGGARLPDGAVARGPAADRHAPRAVGSGDDRRAVREADEASAPREPERLARLAAEVRRTAPDAAGIACLAGRHDPVPAGARHACVRIERAVGSAAERASCEAE